MLVSRTLSTEKREDDGQILSVHAVCAVRASERATKRIDND
jgi:hypothetical protein